jgi:hypothetical protein
LFRRADRDVFGRHVSVQDMRVHVERPEGFNGVIESLEDFLYRLVILNWTSYWTNRYTVKFEIV